MRRRQRSVRVTVSVTLLSLASAVVVVALPTQSPFWLSMSSVLAIALSWGALRIMWTEVLQSRRENAADRAAAAKAYRSLFSQRASEHAEFTTAMTERLAEAHISRRELEGLVTHTETRARISEAKLREESKRVVSLQERVEELESALAVRHAEEADALATWEAEGGDTVEKLAEWDQEAARGAAEVKVLKRA
jgi:chromosome segregation ATPase